MGRNINDNLRRNGRAFVLLFVSGFEQTIIGIQQCAAMA